MTPPAFAVLLLGSLLAAAPLLPAGMRGLPPADWEDAGAIIGVNTHNPFPMPEPELDLLQQAGIRWIRTDVSWSSIETVRGEYNYTRFETFFQQLATRNIGWISILGDSNPLYGAPQGIGHLGSNATAAQIEGYVSFARDIAQKYSNAGVEIIWELINEPNTGGGYSDPLHYVAVVLPAGKAIHAANGSVAIGSLANVDVHPDPETPPPHSDPRAGHSSGFVWLETVLKNGGGTIADYITVHPYRPAAPETFLPDAGQLERLIAQYSPVDRRPRLSQGEWGYSYCGNGMGNCVAQGTHISAETEGKLMVRMYLTSLAGGARPAIWYDWKSGPTAIGCNCTLAPKPPCCGEHMGMIDDGARPLPSWHGVRTLSAMVSGMVFQGKLDMCGDTPCPQMGADWALGFTNATHTALTVWSVGSSPHEMELRFAFGQWEIFDWRGNALGRAVARAGSHIKLHSNSSCGDMYAYIDQVEQCAPVYLVQRREGV